jgi:phage baseplate assembly protein V
MFDFAGIEFRLAELERRLANVVRHGVIAEADYDAARVRVRYDTDESGSPVLTSWLPWQTRRAGAAIEWWAPEVGEQVTVLSPSGEFSQGVVLPALFSTAHPAPSADPKVRRTNYGDDSFVEYDENTHKMTVTVNGGDMVANVTGNMDAVIGGYANVTANDINLDGAGGGGVKGAVQGDCLCAFTGAPHPQVSASVKASK